MPSLTVVRNLASGAERHFSLTAPEALVAAWEQDRGNFNTWTYADSKAPVVQNRWTLSADDWTVRK